MHIQGIGYYAPERIVDNDALSADLDTSDAWIRSRTGIRTRRLAADNQACSDLAAEAGKMAIISAGCTPENITHIIVGTVSGDAAFPATACLLQSKLKIPTAMAFDLGAACSGFLFGMQVAQGIMAAEPEATILLVGAETLSRRVNWQDRSTCVLFGDGAGAVVLKASPDACMPPGGIFPALVEGVICEGGGGGELLCCYGGGTRYPYRHGDIIGPEYFLHMNGQEVFKHAVRAMSDISSRLLKRLGRSVEDLDLVVPHQANLRIVKAVLERLQVPEGKAFLNLDRYGNTSAASIPMALAEAHIQGVIRPGFRVLLTTFGAGFTWGAALVKY
ncbi:MAG: ketoacyl-ACP synthase III [Desulfovibrio sp.]|jgi:3-oxoacyl-[acyl-carrier-protein] synthase-3|nr:ketoacyl-ACP synthase III [Desulfovibrio sp.]